ncbi:MAG TPA: glycosyltransferase [Candidatus Kapabacteria bacterium]
MRVIYITTQGQDNLEDGVFHGLRSLFGEDCVEYPKKERMYRGFVPPPDLHVYGRLFTLWKTLDDIDMDRNIVYQRIKKGDYDLLFFGSIHRSFSIFRDLYQYLDPKKTILLDGEDHMVPRKGTQKFIYFKRELSLKVWYYLYYKMIPRLVYRRLPLPGNMRPTAFAIPKEKITYEVNLSSKVHVLPAHIVDEEVRQSSLVSHQSGFDHVFTNELDYYRNLQESKFGITTKRGGWDCLRHYEIAANGAVVCFRDLDQKPLTCAPHGLDKTNCITYNSVNDLQKKIESISNDEYEKLKEFGYKWIEQQTTEYRAREIIDASRSYFSS